MSTSGFTPEIKMTGVVSTFTPGMSIGFIRPDGSGDVKDPTQKYISFDVTDEINALSLQVGTLVKYTYVHFSSGTTKAMHVSLR